MAYLLTLLVFAIVLVQEPLLSATPYWDTGNALGFLGFAGLLYLFLDVGFSSRQRVHRIISYLSCAAIAGHVLWLWLPDPTLWRYAAPAAPAYMFAGFGALTSVIATVVLALPGTRRFWHPSHKTFRRWHYWASVLAIVAALWHIIGSGFYTSTLEAYLLALLTAAVLAAHHRKAAPAPAATIAGLWGLPLIAAAFVGLKALGA